MGLTNSATNTLSHIRLTRSRSGGTKKEIQQRLNTQHRKTWQKKGRGDPEVVGRQAGGGGAMSKVEEEMMEWKEARMKFWNDVAGTGCCEKHGRGGRGGLERRRQLKWRHRLRRVT